MSLTTLAPWCLAVCVFAAEPATRPARNPSVPLADLLSFHGTDGTTRLAQSPREWDKRRQQILAAMQEVMGPLPRPASNHVESEVVERTHEGGISRLKLRLQVEPDDRLPAYLLIPDRVSAARRAPAVLALHQTTRIGKGEPVGLGGKPNLHYGIELARRGYVVLAPDYPSFGDYPYDFRKSAFVSGTMKGIFNHMRCVDYLCSRDDVDPKRLGVIGHSLGGHNAIFVGAFDTRLQVVVSSCGWTPFHEYLRDLSDWAPDRYMPRIHDLFGNDPDRMPFELQEVVAALAPRAFFSNSPLRDDDFNVAGVRQGMRQIHPVYDLFGAANRLVARYPEAGHDFPVEVRQEAYRFIDSILKQAATSQGP